ncbi:hypothetical protein E6C60_4102 [Paenibacillus algicola]|uniref:Uncharacterized protein n=1 Tax=Paenibacillus algicola TaxID=2565926 RepID=A0A4P8XPE6_9BACL|nr:hypothetical protein E6C60_4102 [Paenibacillus algicola]
MKPGIGPNRPEVDARFFARFFDLRLRGLGCLGGLPVA